MNPLYFKTYAPIHGLQNIIILRRYTQLVHFATTHQNGFPMEKDTDENATMTDSSEEDEDFTPLIDEVWEQHQS
jgi:hypothetical protein